MNITSNINDVCRLVKKKLYFFFFRVIQFANGTFISTSGYCQLCVQIDSLLFLLSTTLQFKINEGLKGFTVEAGPFYSFLYVQLLLNGCSFPFHNFSFYLITSWIPDPLPVQVIRRAQRSNNLITVYFLLGERGSVMNNIMVIKWRVERWTGHVAHMESKSSYKTIVGKPKWNCYPGVEMRIILKLKFKTVFMRIIYIYLLFDCKWVLARWQ
jgi:hypothetical protein